MIACFIIHFRVQVGLPCFDICHKSCPYILLLSRLGPKAQSHGLDVGIELSLITETLGFDVYKPSQVLGLHCVLILVGYQIKLLGRFVHLVV